MPAAASERTRTGERGLSLIEVLAAAAIGTLVLSTIYLAVGTAIRSRLLVGSTLHNQQHGRLIVQWMGDRLRQAGYGVTTSDPVPRCRDALVVEDAAYRPTASSLHFNTDLDGIGFGSPTQTIGFVIGTETAGGTSVNVIQEVVMNCTTGALTQTSSLSDPTSVSIVSLSFAYYDANGAQVTDLVTPASIRSIRMVRMTLVERSQAGTLGPRDQTWTVLVHLRNPDPRTL